jgi:hypothetical protein
MFLDAQLTLTRTQGAAVEPKDFSRAVFSADFPMGLFKCLDNMVTLNRFQGFFGFCLNS